MKTRVARKVVILLCIFSCFMASAIATSQNPTVAMLGSIVYGPIAEIRINASKEVGTNNLSLGFMLDWYRWKDWMDSSVCRELARSANFKIVRVFDFRSSTPQLKPCIQWNEANKTGTWDWSNVDALVQRIFETGAEPLFCLGWATNNIQYYIPSGMAVNATTNLPNPESYAAYAREWVKHFKTLGLPVKHYEIMNEPVFYFGWSLSAKLGYYVELWNVVARAMRSENQNVLLSQDCTNMKMVLDYWLQYGDNVDYLDFHKYDADNIDQYSEAQMFNRAELIHFETTTSFYGVDEARQRWFNARGKLLPVINSESNFNSAYQTGTDPKIQQMTGAVWLALVLRKAILEGLEYSVYFEFSSSRSQQMASGTGWGFGMVNEDDHKPWYPYYVQQMIGSKLSIGDRLIETTSTSDDLRSIAWIHNDTINALLICKVNQPINVAVKGIDGQINLEQIDNLISYETPSVQNTTINTNTYLALNGYTVLLLQITAVH